VRRPSYDGTGSASPEGDATGAMFSPFAPQQQQQNAGVMYAPHAASASPPSASSVGVEFGFKDPFGAAFEPHAHAHQAPEPPFAYAFGPHDVGVGMPEYPPSYA
jgi:hypothetical protein